MNPKMFTKDQATELIGQPIEREHSLHELLKRPNLSYADIMRLPGGSPGAQDEQVVEQVEIQTKYQGYIDRQYEEVARQKTYED